MQKIRKRIQDFEKVGFICAFLKRVTKGIGRAQNLQKIENKRKILKKFCFGCGRDKISKDAEEKARF